METTDASREHASNSDCSSGPRSVNRARSRGTARTEGGDTPRMASPRTRAHVPPPGTCDSIPVEGSGRVRASKSAQADGGFDRLIYHRKVRERSWLCGSAANNTGSTLSSTVIGIASRLGHRIGVRPSAWNASVSNSSKAGRRFPLPTVEHMRRWTSQTPSNPSQRNAGPKCRSGWLRTGLRTRSRLPHFSRKPSCATQHVYVARERGQHMEVFLALGDKSSVERACRANISTRLGVQSFLRTPRMAHISNKLYAAPTQCRSGLNAKLRRGPGPDAGEARVTSEAPAERPTCWWCSATASLRLSTSTRLSSEKTGS